MFDSALTTLDCGCTYCGLDCISLCDWHHSVETEPKCPDCHEYATFCNCTVPTTTTLRCGCVLRVSDGGSVHACDSCLSGAVQVSFSETHDDEPFPF